MSNQIQLRECASKSYCARSWRQQTHPSWKKIFHQVENVIKQLVHTSAVRSSRYEALGKFGEHSRSQSCSRLCLEQLLHIFHALQTSRMLHISMNAQWRMNQLLMKGLFCTHHNIGALWLVIGSNALDFLLAYAPNNFFAYVFVFVLFCFFLIRKPLLAFSWFNQLALHFHNISHSYQSCMWHLSISGMFYIHV